MKNIFLTLSLFVLLFASCSNNQEMPKPQQEESGHISKNEVHKNYVYSLFMNSDQCSYQMYRNNEKFAIFNTETSRKVVAMEVYSGDCYLLISNSTKDSVNLPSEIYKNGKPAMIFQENFTATDFNIVDGHFYVLGSFADSVITVFKDGVRYFNTPKNGKKPLKIRFYDDMVYFVVYSSGKTEVYNEEKKLFEIEGECQDFAISDIGIYVMADGKIYHNGKMFMEGGNNYTFLRKELIAEPKFFSISDKYCYTGVDAALNKSLHYAGVFKNRDPFITIKPDDKPLGNSPYQTRCCGISACKNGAYFVTVNCIDEKNYCQNTFHYYFETDEVFSLEPSGENAKLLFIKGY